LASEPKRFRLHPDHLVPGATIQRRPRALRLRKGAGPSAGYATHPLRSHAAYVRAGRLPPNARRIGPGRCRPSPLRPVLGSPPTVNRR
jgi:hypothetical protein